MSIFFCVIYKLMPRFILILFSHPSRWACNAPVRFESRTQVDGNLCTRRPGWWDDYMYFYFIYIYLNTWYRRRCVLGASKKSIFRWRKRRKTSDCFIFLSYEKSTIITWTYFRWFFFFFICWHLWRNIFYYICFYLASTLEFFIFCFELVL